MPLALTHNFIEPAEWTDANDIFLVSDLHMADGRTGPFGKFTQGENFFWDESFARFLEETGRSASKRTQTLVVNGDFFDFLRVDRIPNKEHTEDISLVQRWTTFLKAIDHPAAGRDLYQADASEKEYGFKTNDFKSVWKLLLIMEGHMHFFDALRSFLGKDGNRLLVLKGNHDLELYWESVRQAFVYFLADDRAQEYEAFNSRITFLQRSITINKSLYIEHGHMYDEVTHSDRDTLAQNPSELDLPVGSLFNRYVINKIEEIEPLFDNIKPPTEILKAVALQYPSKLLKIIFHHLVGAWKIVRKNHVKYAARIVGKIFSVGLPVIVFGVLLVLLYLKLRDLATSDTIKWIVNTVGSLAGAFAVRWIQNQLMGVDSSSSLLEFAETVHRRNSALKLVTFGHTHVSEMHLVGGDCWYINSGTWIPTIEIGSNKVRDTNTFCVLRIVNNNGILQREPLLRWDDERGGLEELVFFMTTKPK